MGFRQLVKRVQHYSGFSDKESKEALIMMVETIASRLNDGERRDFAAQLPEQLQDIALSVYPALDRDRYDIVAQFMYYQNIGKARAKKQIYAAWQAINDAISEGQINDIKAQLPNKTVALLS